MKTKSAGKQFYAKHCGSNLIAIGKTRADARDLLIHILWELRHG